MEIENNDFSGGKLQISTSVLARIAKLAASEVPGVKCVKNTTLDAKGLLNKNNIARSVLVSMNDGVAEVSIGIEVVYGYRIPGVSSAVQEGIKAAIQNMAGVTVSKVNVVVAGVSCAS